MRRTQSRAKRLHRGNLSAAARAPGGAPAARSISFYTSDVGDLERLRAHFPSVRVLGM